MITNTKKVLSTFVIIAFIFSSYPPLANAIDDKNLKQAFKGDEAFLTYPLKKFRLKKERVIIRHLEELGLTKLYFYSRRGKLERIHIPEAKVTVLIEEYGNQGEFVIIRDEAESPNISKIIGGEFDNFNLDYTGGSGISDWAVEDHYLSEIIDITETSVSQLTKAIGEYKKKTGRLLTEEEFNRKLDLDHPLMTMNKMNLIYFFDGHGDYLGYRVNPDGSFLVYSLNSERDKALEQALEGGSGIFDDAGVIVLGLLLFELLIIGAPILLIVAGVIALLVWATKLLIKKIRHT